MIFQNSEYREMFRIDSNGCHVPEGVSIDEAAAGVIDALDEYIKNMNKTLIDDRNVLLEELERLREIRLILHDPFSNRDHQVIDMIIDYLMDKRFSK